MTHCNLRTVLSTTLQIISADEWLRRQSAITVSELWNSRRNEACKY